MNIVHNNKGFKVLQLTPKESLLLNFGVIENNQHLVICAGCNNSCNDSIYYISVLNDCMCENCFKEWLEDATYYIEDKHFEDQMFNHYYMRLKYIEISMN